MWQKLLDRLLKGLIVEGALEVTLPGGTTTLYGQPDRPPIRIRLSDPARIRQFVTDPEMALGDAYTEGTLTVENDDIGGLIALALRNMNGGGRRPHALRPEKLMSRLNQITSVARAKSNVAHHYDLSNDFYRLFLDADMQYSCAYFEHPEATLEEAQIAKKRHIARKLRLEPGMSVLDIGCGWGGMAMTLAQEFGARVTGVTLSEDQHRLASERVAAAGLQDRVRILLRDYREVEDRFDRIVSVGMFEHVGMPQYGEYFAQVHDKLAPDGVALIHTIGRTGTPVAVSPWIIKRIFPGGHVPTLSETMPHIERSGLYPCDIEILRLHYAETLHHWERRVQAKRAEIEAMFDARFWRMWRFYLLACEMTFRHGRQAVFQFQLAKDQGAVPLTRDYLYGPEKDAMQGLREAG
ncbi:SAM-dependent methyltransferase [Mangrovicoccus algicola]|uniref:Class I SAM-dependent methyltransferase n=1 Tax=Mangrovicoccus algicola TaxID=2771008 RepID=A0A8J7CHE2_9RHOB|nr:cyclopropane-fatty-acyl-phospholipid synthase family protein [Mangrovicoccus algicola]MBE3638085.1 class I SAM-dependent methyltransferase [Mangrovicoccus algicola]